MIQKAKAANGIAPAIATKSITRLGLPVPLSGILATTKAQPEYHHKTLMVAALNSFPNLNYEINENQNYKISYLVR